MYCLAAVYQHPHPMGIKKVSYYSESAVHVLLAIHSYECASPNIEGLIKLGVLLFSLQFFLADSFQTETAFISQKKYRKGSLSLGTSQVSLC